MGYSCGIKSKESKMSKKTNILTILSISMAIIIPIVANNFGIFGPLVVTIGTMVPMFLLYVLPSESLVEYKEEPIPLLSNLIEDTLQELNIDYHCEYCDNDLEADLVIIEGKPVCPYCFELI